MFPSERGTSLSRDNPLRRNLQKKLEKISLGWVNFQVLRRTQASLGHKEGRQQGGAHLIDAERAESDLHAGGYLPHTGDVSAGVFCSSRSACRGSLTCSSLIGCPSLKWIMRGAKWATPESWVTIRMLIPLLRFWDPASRTCWFQCCCTIHRSTITYTKVSKVSRRRRLSPSCFGFGTSTTSFLPAPGRGVSTSSLLLTRREADFRGFCGGTGYFIPSRSPVTDHVIDGTDIFDSKQLAIL